MKLSDIEVGQVYVIASNDWYANGRSHVVTRAKIKDGTAAVPAFVLGVGKYRWSLQPCGRKVVESENPKGDTFVWVTYPKQRVDEVNDKGEWVKARLWTWDKPFDGLDPWTEWEWTEKLVPASAIFSLTDFTTLRDERKAIDLEVRAMNERMQVLRDEIAQDVGHLVPTFLEDEIARLRLHWWGSEGRPDRLEFVLDLTGIEFEAEVEAKIAEISDLQRKVSCQR